MVDSEIKKAVSFSLVVLLGKKTGIRFGPEMVSFLRKKTNTLITKIMEEKGISRKIFKDTFSFCNLTLIHV